MKKKTINVLVVIALFSGVMFTSCLKGKNEVTPAPTLSGSYEGVLKKLKRKSANSFDTVYKFGVTLRMKADSGFTLLSDSVIHANSNGAFINDYNYTQFNDKTYKDTTKKLHLHGIYSYSFNGTRLQFAAGRGDSIVYFYDLKKR